MVVGVKVQGNRFQSLEIEDGVGKLERIDGPIDDPDSLSRGALRLDALQDVAQTAAPVPGQNAQQLRLDARAASKPLLPQLGQRGPAKLVKTEEKAGQLALDPAHQRRACPKAEGVYVGGVEIVGLAGPDLLLQAADGPGFPGAGAADVDPHDLPEGRGVLLLEEWIVKDNPVSTEEPLDAEDGRLRVHGPRRFVAMVPEGELAGPALVTPGEQEPDPEECLPLLE